MLLSIVKPHQWMPVGLFIIIAAFSAATHDANNKETHQAVHSQFLKHVNEYDTLTQHSVVNMIEWAVATSAFINARENVARTEFKVFATTVLEKHPEIQALEWLPIITNDERAEYEKSVQSEGYLNYEITELGAENSFVSAKPRSFYFPVHYLEPYLTNEVAFGFDAYAIPDSKKAIDIAIRQNDIAFSPPFTLVQETGSQKSILAYFPVYKNRIIPSTASDRENNIKGVVLLILRMEDFLSHLKNSYALEPNLHYKVTDATEDDSLLVQLAPENAQAEIVPTLEHTSHWQIAGRQWQMTTNASPAYAEKLHKKLNNKANMLFIGLLFSTFISLALYLFLRRRYDHHLHQLHLNDKDLEYHRLLRQTSEIFFLHDKDGHFLDMNHATCISLGYKESELLNMSVTDIQSSASTTAMTHLWSTFTLGEHQIVESQYRTKTGQLIPVEIRITLFDNGSNHVFSVLAKNISQQKQLEAKLIDAKIQAEKANQAKSYFLAKMSHDLRTPMHSILNFSNFGINRYSSVSRGKLKEYFDHIDGSAQRLLIMLSDLLDISQLESGRMRMNFDLHDIQSLIKIVLSELDVDLKTNQITISQNNTAATTTIEMDDIRIIQVISNLISNAIKYSETNTTISIIIKDGVLFTAINQKVPAIELVVLDQGIGIPEEKITHIFDKFNRYNTNKHNEGHGLGLAISKEITEAHHGRIWAKNNTNSGTSLHILLPVSQSEIKGTQ